MKMFAKVFGALIFAVSLSANASIMVHEISGVNDCAGYFSDPFGPGANYCQIWELDGQGDTVAISPIIAGFDAEISLSEPELINSDFGTIDGSEWSIDNSAGDGTGDWTYTAGAGDPGIRYWVAKASNGFNLFWEVDDATVGTACSTVLSLSCLNEALIVTSGDWYTPLSSSGKNGGLSHISFYDSEPPVLIPEPASIALMGLGLLGMGAAARRRKQS